MRGTTYGEGGLLPAPWMVPGGTNYSAVDSPGGPLLGGTTYSMTHQLHTHLALPSLWHSFISWRIKMLAGSV